MSRADRKIRPNIAGSITERAAFALAAIRRQDAVVKTIKTISGDEGQPDPLKKHWDFWLDQWNSPATVRPVYQVAPGVREHVIDPRTGGYQRKLEKRGRARPGLKPQLHRHAKKTPVSLLPANGRMNLYDSPHTVGILFYVPWCDHKDEKYIFTGNIRSNAKPWLGLYCDTEWLHRVHRTLAKLREHNDSVQSDRNPPSHTELDWGVSKESMAAIFATRNTHAAVLNAIHKAIYVEQRTGLRLPILVIDPGITPYESTPEAQRASIQWASEGETDEHKHCQTFLKQIADLLGISTDQVADYFVERAKSESFRSADTIGRIYDIASQVGVDQLPLDTATHGAHGAAAAASASASGASQLAALVEMAVARKNHILLYQLLSKYSGRIELSQLLDNTEYPELVIQLILLAVEDKYADLLQNIIRLRPDMANHVFMNHHKLVNLLHSFIGSSLDSDVSSLDLSEAINILAFADAVDQEDFDRVSALLKQREFSEILEKINLSKLAVNAAQKRHFDLVEVLIDFPEYQGNPKDNGIILLRLLHAKRYQAAIKFMRRFGEDIQHDICFLEGDETGKTALHYLIAQDDVALLIDFLEAAVTSETLDSNECYMEHESAIEMAFRLEKYDHASALLRHGAKFPENFKFDPEVQEVWSLMGEFLSAVPSNFHHFVPKALEKKYPELASAIMRKGLLNDKKIIDAIVAVDGGLAFLLEHKACIHPAQLHALLPYLMETSDLGNFRALLMSGAASQWRGDVSQLVIEAAKLKKWDYFNLLITYAFFDDVQAENLGQVVFICLSEGCEQEILLPLLRNSQSIKAVHEGGEGDTKGFGPLHLAVKHGMKAVLLALLQAPHRFDPNNRFVDGTPTATELAFAENKTELLLLLMQHGGTVPDEKYVAKAKTDGGWEFLESIAAQIPDSAKASLFAGAVEAKQMEWIDRLQSEVITRAYSSPDKKHPIIEAASTWDMVIKLSTYPCDQKDLVGYGSALFDAGKEQQADAALSLLRHSSNISLRWHDKTDGETKGFSVAHFAVKHGMEDVLLALLRAPHRFDPNERFIKGTPTATEFAFSQGNTELLIILLQYGGTVPDALYIEKAKTEGGWAFLKTIEAHIPDSAKAALFPLAVADGQIDWIDFLQSRSIAQPYMPTASKHPIVLAASVGQWPMVQKLSTFPCDKEDRMNYGAALLDALGAQKEEVALSLLQHSPSIGLGRGVVAEGETKGFGAAHFAVKHGMKDVLLVLLRAPHRFDPNMRFVEGGLTATEFAFAENKTELLLLLMQHGGKVPDNQFVEKAKTEGGWEFLSSIEAYIPDSAKAALLAVAAKVGKIDWIDRLQCEAVTEVYSSSDSEHPIVAAANAKKWDVVTKLSTYPCDPKDAMEYGHALLLAARENQEIVALSLIQHSSNMSLKWSYRRDSSNPGFGVIHFAVQHNMKKLLFDLLVSPNPVDPNHRHLTDGKTATELAFEMGNVDCLLMLLQHGGQLPIEIFEKAGFDVLEKIKDFIPSKAASKLLLRAAEEGRVDWLNPLLRLGAHLTEKNDAGDTAIVAAARAGHWAFVTRFAFIPTDDADKAGYAIALKLAYAADKKQIVKNLIKYSACLDACVLGLSGDADADTDFVRRLLEKNEIEILTALLTTPDRDYARYVVSHALAFKNTEILLACSDQRVYISKEDVLRLIEKNEWDFLVTLREAGLLPPIVLFADLLPYAARAKQTEWVVFSLKNYAGTHVLLAGKTAIEHAAENKDWETVSKFIVYPTSSNDQGRYVNAFLQVLEAGEEGLARDMWEHALVHVPKAPIFNRLAKAGHWNFLESQEKMIDVEHCSEIILYAFSANRLELASRLLDQVGTLELVLDDSGNSIIVLAARSGDSALLARVIGKFTAREDLNESQVFLAIEEAIGEKNYGVLKQLLEVGAGFPYPAKNISHLITASQWDLLEEYKDKIVVDKISRLALLKYAIRDNRVALVEALLTAEVQPDDFSHMLLHHPENDTDKNPVPYAISRQQFGILSMLLAYKAPCDFEDLESLFSLDKWDLLEEQCEHFDKALHPILLLRAIENNKAALALQVMAESDFSLDGFLAGIVSLGDDAPKDVQDLTLKAKDIRIVDAFMQAGMRINNDVARALLTPDQLQNAFLKQLFGYLKFPQVTPTTLALTFDDASQDEASAALRVAFNVMQQSSHITRFTDLAHMRDLAYRAFQTQVSILPEAQQGPWVEWALQQPIFNQHCSPISMGKPKYIDTLVSWQRRLTAQERLSGESDSAAAGAAVDAVEAAQEASRDTQIVDPAAVRLENLEQMHAELTQKLGAYDRASNLARLSAAGAGAGAQDDASEHHLVSLQTILMRLDAVIELHPGDSSVSASAAEAARSDEALMQAIRKENYSDIGAEIVAMEGGDAAIRAVIDSMVEQFGLAAVAKAAPADASVDHADCADGRAPSST